MPVGEMKGVVAEGGPAETVLGDGNNIPATVAYAESYLNDIFYCEEYFRGQPHFVRLSFYFAKVIYVFGCTNI